MRCVVHVGDGILRKVATIFILFLFLLGSISIFIPTSVKAGFSIWPGKLNIKMPEGYPEEVIKYEIRVTNNNPYDINVSSEIKNPNAEELTDKYTPIPDLSWISITPEILCIPAKEHRYFTVSIDIPDSEKPLHYNEKWDVRAIISDETPEKEGQVAIQVKLITKILINTPSKEMKWQIPQICIIIIGGIIALIATFALIFPYVKKKKRNIYKNKAAIFHFKKKERTNKSKKN